MSLLIRALTPYEGPTLRTSSKPITSQRPHLQTIPLGIGASSYVLWADTAQSIAGSEHLKEKKDRGEGGKQESVIRWWEQSKDFPSGSHDLKFPVRFVSWLQLPMTLGRTALRMDILQIFSALLKLMAGVLPPRVP